MTAQNRESMIWPGVINNKGKVAVMIGCKNIFKSLCSRIIVLTALVCLFAISSANAQLARSGIYTPQGFPNYGGGFNFGDVLGNNNNGNTGFGTVPFTYTGGTPNSVTTDDGHTTVIHGQGTGSSAYKTEGGNPPSNSTEPEDKSLLDKGIDAVKGIAEGISDYFQGWIDFIAAGMEEVKEAINNFIKGNNKEACSQSRMDDIYHKGCYSCKVLKSLLTAFLNGCRELETVAQEAGQKILLIGIILWIAFYIMKQVSSLKNIEPGAMVNDLLIMLFKVLFAWFAIKAGFELAIDFALVPLLSWGADFGSTMAQSIATAMNVSIVNQSDELVSSPAGFLPADFLNKMMALVASVDGTTSQHMKLGHMLICHSTHAGSWYVIPNLWTWLCGALIWCVGFFMTLAIVFYLVDMSFKMSLSLIALPIVAGLWPFGITSDRFVACIKIIFHAAGILIFLPLTASVAVILVDKALTVNSVGGIADLYQAVEDGDTDFISEKISIASTGFILLVFAYFYGLKVIGATVGEYVNVFFSDGVLGSTNPMHEKMTEAVALIKHQAGKVTSLGGDIAEHQGGKLFDKGTHAVGRKAASVTGSGMKVAGSSMKISGKAVKGATKATAAGINATGNLVGGGINAVLPGAGSVVQAGAKAAATAVEKSGEMAGNAIEKTGEAVKKAGETVKRVSRTAKQAAKAASKASSGGNNND